MEQKICVQKLHAYLDLGTSLLYDFSRVPETLERSVQMVCPTPSPQVCWERMSIHTGQWAESELLAKALTNVHM